MCIQFIYCGIQVVPHIIDAIQEWIGRVSLISMDGSEGPSYVCVIEQGGTIGKDNFVCWVVVFLVSTTFTTCYAHCHIMVEVVPYLFL